MKKSLKQEIINKKVVIENGINDTLKMALNVTIYIEKHPLLQGRNKIVFLEKSPFPP